MPCEELHTKYTWQANEYTTIFSHSHILIIYATSKSKKNCPNLHANQGRFKTLNFSRVESNKCMALAAVKETIYNIKKSRRYIIKTYKIKTKPILRF